MRALLVACVTTLLVGLAAPASASSGMDVSFRPDDAGPGMPADVPIVVAGEPTRACASPAFAQPIDGVDAPQLAATGIGPALQVAALAAFAVAGLMAPRRRRAGELGRFRPHGPGDPQD